MEPNLPPVVGKGAPRHAGSPKRKQRPSSAHTDEFLKKVIIYQRLVIGSILCYAASVVVVLTGLVSNDAMGPVFITCVLFGMVSVVLLSTTMSGIWEGVATAIFSIFPCAGIVVLLVVNQRATKLLQANGIKVGLFGAKL